MERPPPPAETPPAPPLGPWPRRAALLLVALGVLAVGGWKYRTSRPDYRLARGQEAVRAGNAAAVRESADRLDAAGYADHARLLRGDALLAFGSPALALDEFNKIRSTGPLRFRAATSSGRCLLDLGDLKEADRVFRFVVEEQPDYADGHRGLAAIAYDLGQLGAAVERLERVAELDPTDARPHRLIGLIQKDMASDAAAEAAYREALRRGVPAALDGELRVELADVLARQTRFADGLAVLDGGPPGGGGDGPAAVAVRAACLRGVGRPHEAADALDRGLARGPSAVLFRLRGQVHQDLVQLPAAVACFERAVELEPNEHQAQYLLGQAYSGVGRDADAARAFARVEALKATLDRITELSREAMAKPWDASVRLKLADRCDEMGNAPLAAMWRKAAAACADTPR